MHEIITRNYFLHLFLFFPYLFFLLFVFFSFFFVLYFSVDMRDMAVAKLRLPAAEGGASSHSRLQRCMRRARGLQQRMQLQLQQQQQQDSEAIRRQPEQPEQQQDGGWRLQEHPRYHLSCAKANQKPWCLSASTPCTENILSVKVSCLYELEQN